MFKEGDRVTVRYGLSTSKLYGGVGINDEMASMGGESFVILERRVVKGQPYPGYYTTIENDWCWTDEMLEGYIKEAEIDSTSRCNNTDMFFDIQKSDLTKFLLTGVNNEEK